MKFQNVCLESLTCVLPPDTWSSDAIEERLLNWVRQGDAEIVPLVGARVVEQLRENLGCLEFTLDDAQMRRLNEVSHIELGFPRDFLEQRFRPRGQSR